MTLKVNNTTIVYAEITSSLGTIYYYFPVGSKAARGTVIEALSSYSLRGPAIIKAYKKGGDDIKVGLSTEAFVEIKEVPYSKADSEVLALNREVYELDK